MGNTTNKKSKLELGKEYLTNFLISIKADKAYTIEYADKRQGKRYRLCKNGVHLLDALTYNEMNQLLRGFMFAKENNLSGLYNL